MSFPAIGATAVFVAGLFAAAPAMAAEDHSHHQHQQQAAQQGAEKPAAVQVKYGDTVLTDQDGRKLKLKSEVFGDKLVVMDFAYTNCTTICPVLTQLLVKVQDQLGARQGKDVALVTISVDPARDTPGRMKEYAAKHGVKPGWAWLTGPTGTVNEVLKGFSAYAPNFEDHPPLVLVGDPKTGEWTRFFGFSDPKDIVAKVERADPRPPRPQALREMAMKLHGIILAGLLGLAVASAQSADDQKGHEGHAGHAAPPAADTPAVTPLANPVKKRDPQAYFTDRPLIDQNGTTRRFYSDVLKGRLIVMNTIFTNCKDACPLITEQMTRVRAALGDSFGKDVYFVSISTDPERDSPQAMKKFAQKNKADVPGWIWLTGKKADIEHILKKLGQWSADVESHSTQLIAWNFNTDKGRKMMPNVPPESIAAQIKLLASDESLLPGLGSAPKAN